MNIIIFLSLLLSLLADYFFSNILISSSIFYPMFFFMTSCVLFKYLNSHNFWIYVIITIIYSALFINNIILGLILFTAIYFINRLQINFVFRLIISLIAFDLLYYGIFVIFGKYPFTLHFYLYKFYKSFFINLIWGFLLSLVLKYRHP